MPGSDKELVQNILKGETDAFTELVKRYHGRVSSLAYSHVGHAADAEDIAQDTFLRVFRNLGKLREPEKFGPWVAKITLHVSKDFLREKARKHIPLEDLVKEGVMKTPVGEAIRKEESLDKVIWAIVAELPEDVQGVVVLRFRENLSYKGIGEFLDLPVSTVRGALYRGTRYLRKRLAPYLAK